MTNMVPAAWHINPAGGRMDDDLEAACMLRAPRASGVFPDMQLHGFSIPEQRSDNVGDCWKGFITHVPVVGHEDIPDGVANWFHKMKHEHSKQVEGLIWKCENVDWKWNSVANELVN